VCVWVCVCVCVCNADKFILAATIITECKHEYKALGVDEQFLQVSFINSLILKLQSA